MKISLEEAARVMRGRLSTAAPTDATGAAINSKKVRPGDLFFALEGSLHDGHEFVDEALFRGASAAVVARNAASRGPELVVEDPAVALADLAAWVRDCYDPLVVGITGSTGKTTVKDFLVSILSPRMPTVASQESFNNDLGVPLTLAACRRETEVVICEMGTRGPGQIARLCRYARPHVGVVTNVGLTHYEMFGSQAGIAAAKNELVRSLPEGGSAVLNADDPLVMGMADGCLADIVTFGVANEALVRASGITSDRFGRHSFRMEKEGDAVTVSLQAAGAHQVQNALAASAAALSIGLSLEDCKAGLQSARLSRWRMEVHTAGGITLVNDAYNANPASVASALETCARMAEDGRLVAVLGCMAELGEVSDREHRRIGALASTAASRLIVVGEQARPIAEGAIAAGMADVQLVAGPDEAISALGKLKAGDVVLVKASRAASLERVATRVMQEIGPTG